MNTDFNEFETLLEDLIDEHKQLDRIISESLQNKVFSIKIQQLKRRKLYLKDQILKLESIIYPNIIA